MTDNTKTVIYLVIKIHRRAECSMDCMGIERTGMGTYRCRIFNQDLAARPIFRVPECRDAEDSSEDVAS